MLPHREKVENRDDHQDRPQQRFSAVPFESGHLVKSDVVPVKRIQTERQKVDDELEQQTTTFDH